MLTVVLWFAEMVGAVVLNEMETLLESPAVAFTTPHIALSEEQTTMDVEPLVEPVVRFKIEPLMLA